MRSILVVALLALSTLALAGCADDAERTPLTSPTPSRSASATGSSTATGTGSSSATGSSTQTSTDASGSNQPPTASLSAAPASGSAPLDVTFSLGGTDPDSDALSWVLHFGDGNQTAGTTLPTTVPHSFSAAGNYTASLVVSDGALNRTATAKVSATGASAPTGPTIEDLCPTDTDAVGNETVGFYATPMDSTTSPGALWIYEESNGMPGLQRNDSTQPTECPTPDTIIF